jgi:hypothetical protein
VADEQQHSWWKSLPGILTAATGFIAALSGLVAGLNQLGVFRREPPAQQVVVTPAPPDNAAQTGPPAPDTATRSAATSVAPGARPTEPAAADHSRAAPPVPSVAPTTRPDTAAAVLPDQAPRLPKGTVLELALTSRACAPAAGQARVTARLVEPVKLRGSTVLPANTTAVLRLRRAGSPATPRVRLDSLVRQDLSAVVTAADARIRSGASGTCLREGTRVAVTLGAALTITRR